MFHLWIGLVLGASAFALPLDMSGSWSANGELVPSHKTQVVVQRVYGEEGLKKLNDLKNQGFTCVYAQANTYRCHFTTIGAWDVPPDHHEKLQRHFAPLAFDLEKTPGEPFAITEAEMAIQWQMPLLAYSAAGKTDSVIYWELMGTNKLQFEINGQLYWPHFETADKIYFRTPVIQSTRSGYTEFFYDVTFEKKSVTLGAMGPLVKICATGNDFLLLDQLKQPQAFDLGQIVPLCHRQTGFGADGFVILRAHTEYAFEWVFYNSDGREAELCGNAARAVSRYFSLTTGRTHFSFLTRVGVIQAEVENATTLQGDVTVTLPPWKSAKEEKDFFFVNTGVPHAVVTVTALSDLPALKQSALKIKALPQFAHHGVNVTFRTNETELQSITFERGVENFTLSCGTGAIAAAISAAQGQTQFQRVVHVPGGKLHVDASPKSIHLKGDTQVIGTCQPGAFQ